MSSVSRKALSLSGKPPTASRPAVLSSRPALGLRARLVVWCVSLKFRQSCGAHYWYWSAGFAEAILIAMGWPEAAFTALYNKGFGGSIRGQCEPIWFRADGPMPCCPFFVGASSGSIPKPSLQRSSKAGHPKAGV